MMFRGFAAAQIELGYFDSARISKNRKLLHGDYVNPVIVGLIRSDYSVPVPEGDAACALHSVYERPVAAISL